MKIAFAGFELPEGKVKYNDAILADLEGKFKPDKVSPYYIELLPDGFEAAEGIAIAREAVLDLLIMDMDKIEGRLSVAEDDTEKAVLSKCYAHLEGEQPVCDLELDAAEREFVNGFGLLSFKPTVIFDDVSLVVLFGFDTETLSYSNRVCYGRTPVRFSKNGIGRGS